MEYARRGPHRLELAHVRMVISFTGGTFNDGGYAGSARYNKRETADNDDLSLHMNFHATDNLKF